MPNAKDYHGHEAHRILVLGNTGHGKTTQLLTLPGRKFAYLFDPNAILTLRGADIEYEEFLPTGVSLDIKSLEKVKGGDGQRKGDSVMGLVGSLQYVEWEKDFEKKKKSGFFDKFDVIALDSCTTLLDLIMDRLLTINGRPGTFPQQDDWGPQMVAFTNIMRELIGMNKTIFITGHLKTSQDEVTQRITQLPLLTGSLREKIPLLFSDIFVMTAATLQQGAASKVVYNMHTVPNQRETPIRTSIRGLKPVEDVTIDWTKPLEDQGIGGLLKKDAAAQANKVR